MCRSRACHLIPDILSFQRARFVFAAESQASYLRTLRSRAREALLERQTCRAGPLKRLGMVVTFRGRRRDWSLNEKLKLVSVYMAV